MDNDNTWAFCLILFNNASSILVFHQAFYPLLTNLEKELTTFGLRLIHISNQLNSTVLLLNEWNK